MGPAFEKRVQKYKKKQYPASVMKRFLFHLSVETCHGASLQIDRFYVLLVETQCIASLHLNFPFLYIVFEKYVYLHLVIVRIWRVTDS